MGLDVAGVGALSNLIRTGLEKVFPDKAKAAEATNVIITPILEFIQTQINAARDVLIAELKGESWLQRNWRPLIMIDFAGLITAHWLGFTVPNISEVVLLNLFDILQVGIGGYVIGRSGEKIASALAPALAAKLGGK